MNPKKPGKVIYERGLCKRSTCKKVTYKRDLYVSKETYERDQ